MTQCVAREATPDGPSAIRCRNTATRLVLTGCRHEHIDSWAVCTDHAVTHFGPNAGPDDIALCYWCAVIEPTTVTVHGIMLSAAPHECPLLALPDPRGATLIG